MAANGIGNLTQKLAETIAPGSKPIELRDKGGRASVPGLLLRIQPSGRKTWYCQYARGKREKLGTFPSMTLSLARKKAKIIMGRAEAGHDYQGERKRKRNLKARTLGGFIEQYYKEYAGEHLANSKETLARLHRSFGSLYDKPMADLSELDIQRWRKNRQGVKFETLKRDLTTLKSCISIAEKEFKVIDQNPLRGVTLRRQKSDPRPKDKAPRYLSSKEENALRATLDAREERLRHERERGNRWREERGYKLLPRILPGEFGDHIQPIVLLALNTGLRRGDLFGLEWRQVDLKLNQIRKVIEKTSHRKATPAASVIPLSGEAIRILTQWQTQSGQEGLVFPSPVTGERLDNINKAWRQIMKDSKIEGFRFHDLRHTFASRLVMAGVDLNTVRELMCHSDLGMTLVYAHLSPDHKAAAIENVFGS